MKPIKIIPVLLMLVLPLPGQSQHSTGYKQDLIVLRNSLEESYPSLYRFKSRNFIDRLLNQGINEINDSTSVRDFYKTLKLILSSIEDGHLSCSAPENLRQQFDEKEKYFPVSLYFSGNKAYVDCSNLKDFAPGTEITAIDGLSIRSIKKEIFKYIVSDGEIETKKYWILNHSFWFYYNLVYGPHIEHEITYKNSREQLLKTTVAAAFKKNIDCKSVTDEGEDHLIDLKFLPHDIALLKIRTFDEDDLQHAGVNFAQVLEQTFKELKKKQITSLIIDLRGNGGGRDTYGALLYSYLSDKAFRYYRKLETTSKILNEKEHPNLLLQYPDRNYFPGKVYILINGLSFSATSEFCNVVQNNRRAVFIGEETGGTYCGNTSGNFIQTVLPYSQFTVHIPTTKYTMFTTDEKNTNRGIIPEYTVRPTIEDLLHKKDAQLNMAVRLAESR